MGESHVCALVAGMVRCWGNNYGGELGGGSVTDPTVGTYERPTAVSGLAGVTAIAAGWNHSCALLSGGAVRCWGKNHYGQLGTGDGVGPPAPAPVSVMGLPPASAVVAAGDHTCALVSGGRVYCWGNNNAFQTGAAMRGSTVLPTLVRND